MNDNRVGVIDRRAPSAHDVERLRLEATTARWRARAILGIAAFALAAALLVPSITVLVQASTSNANGHRIDELTRQLSEARQQLATADTEQQDRDACGAKFATASRTASRETTAGIARLVIIISTTPLADREAAIGNGVAQLSDALKAYEDATNAQNVWQTLPPEKQLPCPV